MYKLPDLPCRKCGGETTLNFIKSSGMDITPTGMFRNCARCGYSEPTDSLDEMSDKEYLSSVKEPNP